MRWLGWAALALALAASAAEAEEPSAFVTKAYERDLATFEVTKGLMPWDEPSRGKLFNRRLSELFARDARYARESHSIGLLDFDPFLARQCCAASKLKITTLSKSGDKAVVVAKFDGAGPAGVEFDLGLEGDSWRIDDIKENDSDKNNAMVSLAAILAGPHECGSDAGKPCQWPPRAEDKAGAPTGPSPIDVVKAIYKSAIKADADLEAHPDAKTTGGYSDEAFRVKYFSTALRKATDGMDAMFLKYHGAIIDWDPILASNGFPDTRGLTVSALKSDADSALVVASFGGGKDRSFVAYRFVREGGAWKVDDIGSAPGAKGSASWSLRKTYDSTLATLPKT
jgi:hypothetical protein